MNSTTKLKFPPLFAFAIVTQLMSCGTTEKKSNDDVAKEQKDEVVTTSTTGNTSNIPTGTTEETEKKPSIELTPGGEKSPNENKPIEVEPIVETNVELTECGKKLKNETFKKLNLNDNAKISDIVKGLRNIDISKFQLCGDNNVSVSALIDVDPQFTEISFKKTVYNLPEGGKNIFYKLSDKKTEKEVSLPVSVLSNMFFLLINEDGSVKLTSNQFGDGHTQTLSFIASLTPPFASDIEENVEKLIKSNENLISTTRGMGKTLFLHAYLPKKSFLDWMVNIPMRSDSIEHISAIADLCVQDPDSLFTDFDLNKCRGIVNYKLNSSYIITAKK